MIYSMFPRVFYIRSTVARQSPRSYDRDSQCLRDRVRDLLFVLCFIYVYIFCRNRKSRLLNIISGINIRNRAISQVDEEIYTFHNQDYVRIC